MSSAPQENLNLPVVVAARLDAYDAGTKTQRRVAIRQAHVVTAALDCFFGAGSGRHQQSRLACSQFRRAPASDPPEPRQLE